MSRWAVMLDDDNVVQARTFTESGSGALGTGWTEVTEEQFADAVVGATMTLGGTFEPPTPAVVTTVSKYRFLSLLTESEDAAIDLAEILASTGSLPGSSLTTLQQKQLAAKIRAWRRRMDVADYVDLAAPEVAEKLEDLKLILIPSPWADETEADARIAAILANEIPA